jgi:putative membrane protein
METVRKLSDYFILFLKGIAMGAADVVPGVSGGTIAFVAGIYEELIASINSINLHAFQVLRKEGFLAAWKYINGNFFLALLSGIFLSILSLAKIISYLIENKPILVWSFFLGLVLASVLYVGKQVKKWNIQIVIGLLVGAVIAYIITLLPPQSANLSYAYIFFSGALAICAMILPGISGSFILLLLGVYKPTLDALHDKNLVFLFFLASGAIVGILSFAKILKWLFDHYENITLAVLTGFIVGSLNKIWPWKEVVKSEVLDGKTIVLQDMSISPFNYSGDNQLWAAVLLFALGFIVIIILEVLANKKSV